MSPKNRFSEENIVNAAFSVVRENGMGALSTRLIAKTLNSSTMPIYSYMKSKKNLEDKLMDKALDLLNTYQLKKRTGDLFIDMGAGFVLFAKNEKNLFRFIYDERNVQAHSKRILQADDQLVDVLKGYPLMNGRSDENIHAFLMQGITYSFGLAHLVISGRYTDLEDEHLIHLVWEAGETFIAGFKMLRDADPEDE